MYKCFLHKYITSDLFLKIGSSEKKTKKKRHKQHKKHIEASQSIKINKEPSSFKEIMDMELAMQIHKEQTVNIFIYCSKILFADHPWALEEYDLLLGTQNDSTFVHQFYIVKF